MSEIINSDSEIIIAQNQEEWNRLLFLLKDPEPNVLWVNCDSVRLKRPLHDILADQLPHFIPYDIHIDEKTESLNQIILQDEKDKIPTNAIIHIFGMEDAIKNIDFLSNLNFQRDSFFRKAPAHIIFWADFTTSAVLTHKTYDFWSWIVFTFDFKTPNELLTIRQKGFEQELILEDTKISLPHKDADSRISHLEHEWYKFMESINSRPTSIKQMKDASAIALALGKEYLEEGKYQMASCLLKKIISINNGLLSTSSLGQAYIDLTSSLRRLGLFEEVVRILKDVLATSDDLNQDIKSSLQSSLALAYMDLGDYRQAKSLLESSLTSTIDFFGQNHSEVATIQSNLAAVYINLERYEDAKSLLESALKIKQTILGKQHPSTSLIKSNLAIVYFDMGNYGPARDLLEEAIQSDVINFGEFHPDFGVRYTNLANVYHSIGQIDKAKDLYFKSLEIGLRNFNGSHPSIAIRYSNLAHVFADLNDISTAKTYMEKAYCIFKNTFGEQSSQAQIAIDFLENLKENDPR